LTFARLDRILKISTEDEESNPEVGSSRNNILGSIIVTKETYYYYII
jgi:hypothetical protein